MANVKGSRGAPRPKPAAAAPVVGALCLIQRGIPSERGGRRVTPRTRNHRPRAPQAQARRRRQPPDPARRRRTRRRYPPIWAARPPADIVFPWCLGPGPHPQTHTRRPNQETGEPPVANIKSQIKRNRQNDAAHERNKAVKSAPEDRRAQVPRGRGGGNAERPRRWPPTRARPSTRPPPRASSTRTRPRTASPRSRRRPRRSDLSRAPRRRGAVPRDGASSAS